MSVKGDEYILTHSGIAFRFVASGPEDVKPEDIAFHLSHICRFTGAVDGYSVAQHSVHVSELVEKRLQQEHWHAEDVRRGALHGLLHDAHEAYVGDVSAPLKRLLPDYQKLESRVEQVVHQKFGVTDRWGRYVKHADLTMLATERRDLLSAGRIWTDPLPEPRAAIISIWPAEDARRRFLARFAALEALR